VQGLRTLLIAMRIIEESEYQEILNKFEQIQESPTRDKDRLEIAE